MKKWYKEGIWEALQTTAIIVAGSVGVQMVLGFSFSFIVCKKISLKKNTINVCINANDVK